MNLVPQAGRLPEHAASVREGFTLPPGRTEAEAIAVAKKHRAIIWSKRTKHEDEKIDEFNAICIEMCCGDRESGERLAKRAIWP